MKERAPDEAPQSMRIDRALVYLRFARTRSIAQAMITRRTLRRNRKHVQRPSEMIAIGDVLTLMIGGEVRIIEILALPQRRTSATLAKCHYRELDRGESDRKARSTHTA
ncbi:S4 domain-containing protein [Erythrobacter sp. YT30]|uniref:S4 domain-containing protein n=1 Tax=Erythrobacter sp. YT30 TaxID=1735012 RepID=UPI000B1437E0|nr:S4 domain-containing protein [Erythrobacter sp. YT30]